MPKARKFQQIHCQHFCWRLMPRDGVWYADGRSNKPSPGRHSLDTRDLAEAKLLLTKLDLKRAVDLGLVKAPVASIDSSSPLPLEYGRRLYERNIQRPIVATSSGVSFVSTGGISPLATRW